MKLSCYLTLHDISVSDFAAQLQLGSRMTLYRYATGRRRPNAAVMARIHSLTNGMVTAEDFSTDRLEKPAKNLARYNTGSAASPDSKPVPKKLDTAQRKSRKKRYAELSPVVQTALHDLGDRADYRLTQGFWLDNRPVSLPALMAAANQHRLSQGLMAMPYPLVNPLSPDGRPQELVSQAISQP